MVGIKRNRITLLKDQRSKGNALKASVIETSNKFKVHNLLSLKTGSNGRLIHSLND